VSVVIHLPFAEQTDEVLPSDSAGGIEDLNGDPGGTPALALPEIVETPAGLARQFGDDIGLIGTERAAGQTRLTQDLTIEAVLTLELASLAAPAVVILRGDGSSDDERTLWGLELHPSTATHAIAVLRWQTAGGVDATVPGVAFRVPDGPFYLWAVRRWVSRSEVEVRYGIGDTPMGTGVSIDGEIEDGAAGTTLVGCDRAPVQFLHLDRADSQYAAITDAAQTGLDITGALTIEARVRFAETPAAAGSNLMIASKGRGSGNKSWWLELRDQGGETRLRFFLSDDGSAENSGNAAFPGGFLVDRWYRVAARFDPSKGTAAERIQIFIDGSYTENAASGAATSIFDGTEAFGVGAAGTGANPMSGDIRDVRIWSRALTDEEIADGPASQTDLEGHWRLDGEFADASGNDNTLTPVNDPTFEDGFDYSRFLPGTIAALRVRDSETSAEELRQVYRAIATHQPEGYASQQALLPPRVYSTDSESIIQREIAVEGGAMGAVVAEVAALVEDGLPDRAYHLLDRWEAVKRLAPRPRDSIATRRARVAGHFATIHGFNVDKVREAVAPLLDCEPEDLEIIEGSNRYTDPFDELKPSWHQNQGGGSISASGGELVLDADGTDCPWPDDAVWVARSIDGAPRVDNPSVGVYFKATLAAAPDVGVSDAKAGILLLTAARKVGRHTALLFGYDDPNRLRLWSFDPVTGAWTVEHTFASTEALPRVLHFHIEEDAIIFATADPADPNVFEESHDHAPSFQPDRIGLALVVDDVGAGAPEAHFDDAAWLMRNGAAPFYWSLYRDPALGGSPDLRGARDLVAALKPAHTRAYLFEADEIVTSATTPLGARFGGD
jgi:sialidase-1